MNAEPVIRNAEARDRPAIVAIYNGTIASRQVTADLVPVTLESRQAWFAEHSPERRPLWVVEHRGTVAAWLSFSSFYGRPAYDHTAELSIYVAAECRRAGLGRSLLRQAIDAAPALGVTILLGFIFGHNAPSLALFESHGFARWGRLPGVARLDDSLRDLVIVGRRVMT